MQVSRERTTQVNSQQEHKETSENLTAKVGMAVLNGAGWQC